MSMIGANGGRYVQSKVLSTRKVRWLPALVALIVAAGTLYGGGGISQAQGNSRTFPQTGNTVNGLFLSYWDANGALPQQGYPITNEFRERSATDGKTYTMQCFERAVFEHHPENAGKPSEVLLSLLGNFYYQQRYQFGAPANQTASTINPRKFNETGKTIGGKFRDYWEANGGLAQQGFPITDEFQEKNQTDGKTYTVQYFERAVFELHPENAGTPYEVLLTLLGKFLCPATNQPQSTAVPPTAPPTAPSPTPNPSFDPNKVYRLTTQFRGDGMCLDTGANNRVVLQNCAAVSGQSWRITSAGGGTWKLSPEFPGNFARCLDGGDFAELATCSGATGQQWNIKPAAGQAGYYTMTSNFLGPTKCLDIVNGGSNNNYARYQNCTNVSGQHWKFTVVP
jgi:hypothetical protein